MGKSRKTEEDDVKRSWEKIKNNILTAAYEALGTRISNNRILPEALETNCLRCTEKQKVVTHRTIKRLRKEYPKIWAELSSLWDPNDIYVRKFEETFKSTPSTTPSENEINLDDRFGFVEVTKKKPVKTTPKPITKKTRKMKPHRTTVPQRTTTRTNKPFVYTNPTTIRYTTSRPRPIYNNIGGSGNNYLVPSYNPNRPVQNFGGNVGTNQVGVLGSNQENRTGSTLPISTELTTSSSIKETSKITSSPIGVTPQDFVESPNTSNTQNIFISQNPPTIVENTSSSEATITTPFSTSTQTTTASLEANQNVGITFDIPSSVMAIPKQSNDTQNFSSPIFTKTSTIVSVDSSSTTLDSDKVTTNRIQFNTTSHNIRYPDIFSQVLSTFLNNNRPPTITVEASNSNDNIRRPGFQVSFPNIPGNGNNLDPVGNLVRGISTVSGRLLETGSNIADSFLRNIFVQPRRVNRSSRRNTRTSVSSVSP
ncbi:hypothetical protein HHI36_000096 [Cryptolaemus montrouzieri]|uniref:Uncharacterized protein n=1 Tax=Cryptolaemus montrouzieri TaxID=559131 RepID=A0ABD2P4E6_9CUCU